MALARPPSRGGLSLLDTLCQSVCVFWTKLLVLYTNARYVIFPQPSHHDSRAAPLSQVFHKRLMEISRDPKSSSRLMPIILEDLARCRELYDVLVQCSDDSLASIVLIMQSWIDRTPTSAQRAIALEMLVKATTKLNNPSLTCVKLDPSEIVAIPGIGGGQSFISRGILNSHNVIIKSPRSKALHRMLQREALISRQLRHPAVLALLGVTFAVPNIRFGIVLPMMEHGDLYKFLYRLYSSGQLPNQVMYEGIMENIASGICYLHQNGIVHADIKPHNILIREQNGVYSAVIADFGIATVGDDVGSDCRPKANDSQASRERLPVWGILGQPLIPDVFSDIWGWGVMCVWGCTLLHPSKQYAGQPLIRPKRPLLQDCKTCAMDDGLWDLIHSCTYRAREDKVQMVEILEGLVERRKARN